jgi:hypothetical protein
MPDLAEQLKTIAENARRLRDAGITGTVKVGDVEFTLEPPDRPVDQITDQAPTSTNSLDDATTYGLRPGSALPGFTDPRQRKA